MLLGPNTGLGHSSMIYMIESQVDHVVGAVEAMQRASAPTVEVRPEVHAAYNQEVDARMRGTVWEVGGCKSFYIDRTGRNATLWPDWTWRFRHRARRPPAGAYQLRLARAGGGERMKAVTCTRAELEVADLATPQPERGQVLLEVTRCGICGSDLHARHHCDELAEVMVQTGYEDFMRSEQSVVFGHEFAGRVAEYGPGCRRQVPAGADVVAVPLVRRAGRTQALGLSAAAPGAYAEQVVVEESLMMAVPNGISSDLSAMTEPMAVGWHAVRRSEIGKRDVAIVVGCGPIGLAVISALKARGVRTVVAGDFSAARRALATACGADIVVDPATDSPV